MSLIDEGRKIYAIIAPKLKLDYTTMSRFTQAIHKGYAQSSLGSHGAKYSEYYHKLKHCSIGKRLIGSTEYIDPISGSKLIVFNKISNHATGEKHKSSKTIICPEAFEGISEQAIHTKDSQFAGDQMIDSSIFLGSESKLTGGALDTTDF